MSNRNRHGRDRCGFFARGFAHSVRLQSFDLRLKMENAGSQVLPMHRVQALLVFHLATKLQHIHNEPHWKNDNGGEQREADEDAELFHLRWRADSANGYRRV